MNYRHRLIEARIAELFKYFPVVAVTGARQVGKTTMLSTMFGSTVQMITFDPVVDLGGARQDPDFFLQNLQRPAFLDEIQYAPELLNSIKRDIDRRGEAGLYLLSGSQNLAVLKNISESLAGRVAVMQLWPMARREKEQDEMPGFLEKWLTNPEDALLHSWPEEPQQSVFREMWRGGYPGILEMPDHLLSTYWQSYIQTYIERDVRTVAAIGSLQSFGHFIGLLSALTAQEINFNELGRELGVARKTALSWTEIAEATFQWITVPAFSRNPVKKIAGKKKGYFTDTGFACYLQRISSPDAIQSHPMKGRLFETFVFMEMLKNMQKLPTVPNIYHFRSYSGAEVDLILEKDGWLYPVEIKAKSNPGKMDTRGFKAFRNCFPAEKIHKGLIVCAVPRPIAVSEESIAVPWWIL